jgi:hypothetical protein
MATTRQRIRFRRDTSTNWAAANPVLLSGEGGYETDTGVFKIGNGTTQWNALPAISVNRLQDLTDVVAANKTNGSVLVYDATSSKFVADDVNTKLTLTDGGNF